MDVLYIIHIILVYLEKLSKLYILDKCLKWLDVPL